MRKYFRGCRFTVTRILRRQFVALLAITGALFIAYLFLSRLNSNSYMNSRVNEELVRFLNVTEYAFLRNNPETCSLPTLQGFPTSGENEFESPDLPRSSRILAVVIISARDHFEYRRSIRETWGSVQAYGDWAIRRIFILGNRAHTHAGVPDLYNDVHEDSVDVRLDEEISKHGDILVADFFDTYLNLSAKHVVGYRWVLENCAEAKYVLKTDDDMFINVFGLLDFLDTSLADANSTLTHDDEELLCHAWQSAPERGAADQWRVSYDVYTEETYPLYCIDAAYVTTPALIRAIYSVHDQVKYLWISDCFVTGLLRVRYNERVAVTVAGRARAHHKIGIHDIQDLYQLNDKKLAWDPRTLFYLLKKKNGMRFERMEAYWSLTLVHQAQAANF